MVLLKALLGSVIGGAIGAAVWAAIAYGTGFEIAWIAIGVGALVGGGALAAVRDEADAMTGVVAAGVAILSLAVGRYATVTMLVDKELETGNLYQATEQDMLVSTADEVVGEWEDAGRTMKWPDGMTVEEADEEADYPKDVWKEATTRWGKLTPEEQQAALQEHERATNEMMAELRGLVVREGFKGSFDFMDILFAGLALLAAYKIGSGMTMDN